MRELDATYPDRQFTRVFGADSVASIDTWDHGRWLRSHLAMLVIQRPGASLATLPPHATELEVDAGAYSSTELRQRMSQCEPFDDLVGAEVLRVLMNENAMLEAC